MHHVTSTRRRNTTLEVDPPVPWTNDSCTAGFNGLDIDWEYPGAPDRGGNADDTANYVLLLQTLRETFDASGGHYGLTFTTPSSYWYLRWFDLPNMMKYADWTNFMT